MLDSGVIALRSYLDANGLTDAEFALRIGVSGELVRLWRHGLRGISPQKAVVISERTGIPRHALRPDLWDPPRPRRRREPPLPVEAAE